MHQACFITFLIVPFLSFQSFLPFFISFKMASPLFDAHNFLVVGKFKQAIQEAEAARPATKMVEDVTAFNEEKAWIIGQAQIELQPEVGKHIISFITDLFPHSSATSLPHPVLQALVRWAEFIKATKEDEGSVSPTPKVREELKNLLEPIENLDLSQVYTAIFAVAALITVKDYLLALQKANEWTCQLTDLRDFKTQMLRLELHYLIVEALLRINRVDLAKGELNEMTKINDESIFTILASGIISLYLAQTVYSSTDEFYNSAKSAFSGAIIRYGSSPMQLNLLALSNIGLGNLKEADASVMEAMELTSSRANEQITVLNHKALRFRKGIQGESTQGDSQILDSSSERVSSDTLGWVTAQKEMEHQLEAAVEAFSC